MFGKKKQSSSGLLDLSSSKQSKGYDPRATGVIQYKTVYAPETLEKQTSSGGFGDPVNPREVMGLLNGYQSETFQGIKVIGTSAGRYLAKRLINHFENYGFGKGYCFDVTKTIAVIPLINAFGCADCPGSTVVITPSNNFSEMVETLYHQYKHNCGDTHENCKRAEDPIFIEAKRVSQYISQFKEA